MRAGDESKHDSCERRLGKNQLGRETTPDRCNQRDHESLNVTEALGLEIKHRQHIQRSDDAPPYQRNTEKKLQANSRPDNFSQIACGNGDFAKTPEKPYGWG